MLQKRKKILYVITKSVWGGAQKYVFDLTTHLSKEQFDVAVVCGGNGALVQKLIEKNIRVISIPYLERDINVGKELCSFFSLLKIFMREKPDVIHLNSSKAGALGAIAALKYKLLTLNFKSKTIFTAHGWGFNEDRPEWQKLIIIVASWLGALFQNKIICVSQYDYESALRYHIAPKRKLVMIHNGIEIDEKYFLPRNEARQTLHIPKHAFVVGTVAELTNNKGLAYLLEAAIKIQETVLFYIIGEGENRKQLEEYITKHNANKKIILAGFVSDASRYLKAFDAFILPSTKEGLPYTLLEAAAAGLPLIGTRVGGIPEIIDDGKNGFLVPPKNSDALTDAIKKLVTNPELQNRFSAANLQLVKDKFSFETMFQKTVTLYR
ncbi:glycosyltransferase family 4 protein [Patescibacteria group bacterium]|nr:glycosyltransferase family 4 protein [Patescibacteria group bacterium]